MERAGKDVGDTMKCAHCGQDVGETRILLVRCRGEHRIGDAFCSLDHLVEWAKRGGRWQARS